jgi:hypothetical protein
VTVPHCYSGPRRLASSTRPRPTYRRSARIAEPQWDSDGREEMTNAMPHYAPYTTTVVGAHSVPRWYESLDRLVALGQLAEGDFVDAQLRVAGIDVITGGEMHRRRHNRHAPPNAMLNHFWHKIPSFQGETRPKPITGYDANVFHPAAICRGPIPDNVDLGLVDEFKTVSSFARKPVKITMTRGGYAAGDSPRRSRWRCPGGRWRRGQPPIDAVVPIAVRMPMSKRVSASFAVKCRRNTRGPWCHSRIGLRQM